MAKGRNLDFNALAKQAIENIEADRQETKTLLNDLRAYVSKGADRHEKNGFALAKYVETLQRSNEQLVKLAVAIKRNTKAADEKLSDDDRDDLFSENGS